MKYSIVLILIILAVSCKNEKKETPKKETVVENLIEYKDGSCNLVVDTSNLEN